MPDIYLYDDAPVLRNKLQIKNEKTLELIEAEQSRANMMLLYEQGFHDFSPKGLCQIHRFLFGDIYDWAGQFRVINIEKREKLLGGRSVWYSNDENIAQDLQNAFDTINSKKWDPFREGNTRTVVMMMTFFVEDHGYYMDQELMAQSSGYVRDSFVMASLDQFSEYEHLEKILLDAICDEPVKYDEVPSANEYRSTSQEKYRKYQKEKYTPEPHYQREE